MSKSFIGIDLGTTNSCIAHCKDGRAEIIPDSNGRRLIPSMVYYNKDNGKIFVGERAYARSLDNGSNFFTGFKRFMGTTYKICERLIQSTFNWNDIHQNHDEMAVFGVEINDKLYLKKPEDVSCEILKHLKLMATSLLNTEIEEAVISVPAYFNNAQRQATKRAAEMAGLRVLRMIAEPTAAALHYVEKLTDGKILVFDWGGGTLDVSLIEIFSNNLKVVAVDGDTSLGGKDIDDLLFKRFYQLIENKECIQTGRKLMEECINLKKELTDSEDSIRIVESNNEKISLKMTREEFEKLCKDIFERALDIVIRALKLAGWEKETLDGVVLVGGSSRIPKIKEMLRHTFGDGKIKTDLNPDEAVALGASIQAAQLKNCPMMSKKYTIEEVTPISLGLRTDVDMMLVFIEKNTRLPAKQRRSATTSKSNQEMAKFEIYEGERKNTKLNNKLGEFIISGLPRKRAGDVEFNIEFSLDLDGILTVAASEVSSGRCETLTINMTEFRWTQINSFHSLDEEEQVLREDQQFEVFAKLVKSYKLQWQRLLYDSDTSREHRKRIQKQYKLFTDSIKDLHFTEKEKLTKIHEELMHDIMRLFVMH